MVERYINGLDLIRVLITRVHGVGAKEPAVGVDELLVVKGPFLQAEHRVAKHLRAQRETRASNEYGSRDLTKADHNGVDLSPGLGLQPEANAGWGQRLKERHLGSF